MSTNLNLFDSSLFLTVWVLYYKILEINGITDTENKFDLDLRAVYLQLDC